MEGRTARLKRAAITIHVVQNAQTRPPGMGTYLRVPAHGHLGAAAAVCSMSCRRVAAPIRTVLPVGGAHPVGQGLVGIAPARATMRVHAGARGRRPRPPERRHRGVREQSVCLHRTAGAGQIAGIHSSLCVPTMAASLSHSPPLGAVEPMKVGTDSHFAPHT